MHSCKQLTRIWSLDGGVFNHADVGILPNLTSLNVDCANSARTRHIARSCPAITELYIANTSLSNNGARASLTHILRQCTKLLILEAYLFEIEPSELQHFRGVPNLTELSLFGVPFTDEHCAELARLMAHDHETGMLRALRIFRFAGSNISSNSLTALGREMSALQVLQLGYAHSTESRYLHVFRSPEVFPSLRVLYVWGPTIKQMISQNGGNLDFRPGLTLDDYFLTHVR